ncbi:MAG: ATP-binding protein [Streptomyces sp.]|nr:ATP-binding protein [Streptomyces sp.]
MALPSNDSPWSGIGSAGTATAATTPHAAGGTAGTGFELPARGEAVAEARRRVREYLRRAGCGADTVETAALLVSELATNAIRHTASPVFACRVEYDGERVRLEVEDHGGTPDLPHRREPGPGDVDGRGLLLVDVLCSEWHVAEGPRGGRIVRAVLPAQPGA